MRKTSQLLLLGAALLAGQAWADTLYVTDRVLADLYATEQTREIIGRLPTGTPVEVIKVTNGLAQVRLPGLGEGWIKREWLSEQVPAYTLLLQLADQHDRARSELKTLRDQHRYDIRPELWMVAVIVGGALLFGFCFGAFWMDRRFRERHGGFRV